MNEYRPSSKTQEERALVVETIVHHWCLGDLKFLYTDEIYAPRGMTMDEFVAKWGEFIKSASSELLDLLGEDLFGDNWDTETEEE